MSPSFMLGLKNFLSFLHSVCIPVNIVNEYPNTMETWL